MAELQAGMTTEVEVSRFERDGQASVAGRQFADAVRKGRPNLPVLLITGYAGTALENRQIARGMEVMTKPFTVDALAARVRVLLKVAHA